MKYQLRIEFPDTSIENYDKFSEIESTLLSKLDQSHDVDGHDFGLGKFGIFIRTNDPESLLKKVLESEIYQISKLANLISYRDVNSEEITTLWKKN